MLQVGFNRQKTVAKDPKRKHHDCEWGGGGGGEKVRIDLHKKVDHRAGGQAN